MCRVEITNPLKSKGYVYNDRNVLRNHILARGSLKDHAEDFFLSTGLESNFYSLDDMGRQTLKQDMIALIGIEGPWPKNLP
jgi:hypothetical protein